MALTGASARWSCIGSSATVSWPSAVLDSRLRRTAACTHHSVSLLLSTARLSKLLCVQV